MKNLSLIALILALVIEVVLAIPVIGGSIIIGFGYTPLAIAFFIHLSLLTFRIILANQHNSSKKHITAPVIGLIASTLGFIPFVGWFLHIVAVAFYVIDLATGKHNKLVTKQ